MGEQAVTGSDGTPAPEQAPDAGGEAAAATGGPPGPATAGMIADGAAADEVEVPGAGMTADAGGATGPQSRTTDIVPGPGGVMTDEVGVVTGELTLRTEFADGQVTLRVQYKDADEWYVVTGGRAPLSDPAGLDAVHTVAVGLLNRPEG
ncbi:hypothetical protein GCM10011608_57140 [Micromonospora sonchi]|uniref:Uncharacterized protein n=1 Tax=Micromonospora sonchi TaxID=1763543 RepID=A0A917U9P3_9ACTN|nr:hypothetical protein [Micromonospora sonchi]GGM64335.1 hypothetical protein GCM10011608_57140 [Micromonospora sonchi]